MKSQGSRGERPVFPFVCESMGKHLPMTVPESAIPTSWAAVLPNPQEAPGHRFGLYIRVKANVYVHVPIVCFSASFFCFSRSRFVAFQIRLLSLMRFWVMVA